jgi:putative nucleotidyltransferase with HDIG domain
VNSDTLRIALRLAGPEGPAAAPGDVDKRAERLRRSTESVLTLPTLPESVSRILGMVDDPETSARALAQAIASDQVLTARVLKLANSSYYGFQQKVGTVSLALVVLGFQSVKDLALTTSVMRTFGKASADARFDMHAFWEHALSVAVASRYLSRVLRVGTVGEAFTAGILHDIGQVVLHEYHPDAFQESLRLSRETGACLHEAEQEVLGAGHPQVGGWLCRRWNLPDNICQAVSLHHGPFPGGDSSGLPALVALGDHLAGSVKSGSEQVPEDLDPRVLLILSALGNSIDPSDLPALRDKVQAQLEESADLAEAFR